MTGEDKRNSFGAIVLFGGLVLSVSIAVLLEALQFMPFMQFVQFIDLWHLVLWIWLIYPASYIAWLFILKFRVKSPARSVFLYHGVASLYMAFPCIMAFIAVGPYFVPAHLFAATTLTNLLALLLVLPISAILSVRRMNRQISAPPGDQGSKKKDGFRSETYAASGGIAAIAFWQTVLPAFSPTALYLILSFAMLWFLLLFFKFSCVCFYRLYLIRKYCLDIDAIIQK